MIDRDVDVPPSTRTALDSLAVLSGKWHPVVVAVLLHRGPLGFNAILEAIPDVSGKVLTGTLEALQEAGLVQRTVVNESPLRVEYALTDAGRGLEPVFDALSTWSERHLEAATPTVLIADADRRITEMYGEWLTGRYGVVRAHNGEELATRLDGAVDVVIYDDGLPGGDPSDVFDSVGPAGRLVALVGDRPAFDLLEIPFDGLLRKPIVRATLIEAVETQLNGRDETPERRERASLAARRSLFERVYSRDRLESSRAYVDLCTRLDELDGEVPT